MPLVLNRDAYSLTFALPTGAFYTVEVTGLQVLAARVTPQDLERWWQVISLELPRLRVDGESYGEAIDRCLAAWLAGPPPAADASPNEGTVEMPEPATYLGMRVIYTQNVRVGAVSVQPVGLLRTRHLYVNPGTPTDVWQAEARRVIARLIQREVPVSIKQTCRYCGKGYPAKQGTSTTPDAYCSDKCRAAASDLIDCPTCGATGGTTEAKCGDCFGSTYKACDACQEDHARVSLMFTNPSTGAVYYVCPACVADEREAGGIQAPQARS